MWSLNETLFKPLAELQPSQLYISAAKLAHVQRDSTLQRPESLEPIPIKALGGRIIMTDGHTRALAALLAGLTEIPVVWDEDELDWEAYQICVDWCLAEGIHTVADLQGRVVPAAEYEIVWHQRCREMQRELEHARQVGAALDAEIRALPIRNAPNKRVVRRRYSRLLKASPPDFVLAVVRALLGTHGQRGIAYELLAHHRAAFQSLGPAELEELGQGIDSWWTVDSFARDLAGPAWLQGQVPDELIARWARSPDRWWRRAALVSTVALNVRSHGGYGDTARTLTVCRMLVDDHDDMVVKGLSWALRDLVVHDPEAVTGFLEEHQDVLAARVLREVRNKLTTGLKNPRRKG
jgi:3-methyladenine DNA glycosylase AlkD